MERKRTIAVIGGADVRKGTALYNIAYEIGELVVDNGFRLITGGLGGIMEAASEGARSSKMWKDGDIIGILPGLDIDDANEFVDIAIPTGLGIGRNMIVTNADGVIAVGGGAGTLSEMAFSWQKGKPIVAFKVEGWSGELAGKAMDNRDGTRTIHGADEPEEALKEIMRSMDHDDVSSSRS